MAEAETILVVDDDKFNLTLMRELCESAGYRVLEAGDGTSALELVLQQPPDLILLDVMMAGKDGFEVCLELRSREETAELPIIIVTALDDLDSKVQGLELGADDYVTKPFGLQELLARIQAVLRRKRKFEREIKTVSFGKVDLDFRARTATVSGRPVELTSREFDLLHFFLSREGEALSRQEILNRVWGFDYFGTDRTVDNFINRLRQKLEPDPDQPRYIQTVRGVGYRFSRGE